MNLEQKFREVVAGVLATPLKESDYDLSWEQLKADSLFRIQITLELESAFNISIPNEVADNLDTPRQALEYVTSVVQPVPEQVVTYGIVDPDYARIFSKARCIAWSAGYACVMNGSFTRDLDLLLVPWTESARNPQHIVDRIADACDLNFIHGDQGRIPSERPHGRLSWTLTFKGFGDPRFVDVSAFQPIKAST